MTVERHVAAVFRKVDLGNCRLVRCTLVPEKLWRKSAWKPFLGIQR